MSSKLSFPSITWYYSYGQEMSELWGVQGTTKNQGKDIECVYVYDWLILTISTAVNQITSEIGMNNCKSYGIHDLYGLFR